MKKLSLWFCVVGPVAGNFGFISTDLVIDYLGLADSALAHPVDCWAIVGAIAVIWLYSLFLAFPIGVLPAWLCGAIFDKIVDATDTENMGKQVLIASGIGFVISGALGFLFLMANSPVSIVKLLPWCIAGAFGGGASAIATYTLRKRNTGCDPSQ